VRPVTLTDKPPTGTVKRDGDLAKSTWKIPRADVAAFLLDQLDASRDVGCTVGIAA